MKKIIFVDDDAGINEIAKMILEKEGYDVLMLQEGKSLIDNNFYADVIILDKHLPDIDGIELCKLLKNKPGTKSIPVIMLSADPNIKQLAVFAGANDVIEKPFSLKDFREVIAKYA